MVKVKNCWGKPRVGSENKVRLLKLKYLTSLQKRWDIMPFLILSL